MYDTKDPTKDFFERTKANLEKYLENNKNDENAYPNEITQLINSLLGLLVVTKEKKVINYDKLNIENLLAKQKIKPEPKNKAFIRHLRNAIAHGHIEANGNEFIESITFEDNNIFEVTLTKDELFFLIEQLHTALE